MVIAGSYEVAVKMMGDMSFLTALLNFPKEQINDETVELLQVGGGAPLAVGQASCRASIELALFRRIQANSGESDGCLRRPFSLLNDPMSASSKPTTAILTATTPTTTPNHTTTTPKNRQPYFSGPDFNYESARKASGNVAGLSNWAAAMCKYHEVAKVVEPKIATLRAAEAEFKVGSCSCVGCEVWGARSVQRLAFTCLLLQAQAEALSRSSSFNHILY